MYGASGGEAQGAMHIPLWLWFSTRMIQESAINLRYLLHKGDDETFDRYVCASLAPDREVFDIIQANIQKRGDGSVLEIEQNMLDSIRDRFASSGVEVGDIDPNRRYPTNS